MSFYIILINLGLVLLCLKALYLTKTLVGAIFYTICFMMPNRFTDTLFQLIKSLEKAEKRHFKLYIKRNSANQDLKVVELFDAMDKLDEYDESNLLKKLSSIQKPQLANIKVHLYKQVLASLRLLKSSDSIDLQLNEQLDFAHILYKKGLFVQSEKIIEKAKETAKANHKINYLVQAIALEKRIETLHITYGMQTKAEQLSVEINEVNSQIDILARLSNLVMLLHSWFIKNGHARNDADEAKITAYLKQHLPANAWHQQGFYEKLYLYQAYSWYYFIQQNFTLYYRYAQKWVSIFDDQPLMIRVETGNYIKGLHTLLNVHFYLRNHKKFAQMLQKLEDFAKTDRVQKHDNFRTQTYVYLSSAKINQCNMLGNFAEGIKLVPEIVSTLKADNLFVDEHRVMVINYKIASMYFGNGNFDIAIDYLQKIINDNADVRNDLQCYARLLHLLAHYEMGNYDLVQYLTKSVYRFMAKKQYLSVVEEEMFKYLRKSFHVSRSKIKEELGKLLNNIKGLEKSRFETRSFTYLDIISWLESKVNNKTMSEVLKEKIL